MKDPRKYNRPGTKILFGIGGIFLVLIFYLFTNSTESLFSLQCLTFIIFYSVLLLSFGYLRSPGILKYRKVTYPVNPKDLVTGQVYYLNGISQVEFKFFDTHTSKYHFFVYGLDKKDRFGPTTTSLYTEDVILYVSQIPEKIK